MVPVPLEITGAEVVGAGILLVLGNAVVLLGGVGSEPVLVVRTAAVLLGDVPGATVPVRALRGEISVPVLSLVADVLTTRETRFGDTLTGDFSVAGGAAPAISVG